MDQQLAVAVGSFLFAVYRLWFTKPETFSTYENENTKVEIRNTHILH